MNLIIEEVKKAITDPGMNADPIVVAVMQNDLRKTVALANEYGVDLETIDEAIRYIGSRVSGQMISGIIKKRGGK